MLIFGLSMIASIEVLVNELVKPNPVTGVNLVTVQLWETGHTAATIRRRHAIRLTSDLVPKAALYFETLIRLTGKLRL